MAEQNFDLVRAAMNAFARRDLEALQELCHPDVELDWSRRLMDPVVVGGFDGMRRFFEEMTGIFEDISFDEEELTAFGDKVLLVNTGTFRGRASGVEVTARAANVWTIRDGKIARFCFYQSKDDALADLSGRPARPRASTP